MKKTTKIIIGIVGALVLLWGVAFTTDFVRCSSLKEPVFVIGKGVTADDGGSGTFLGLGYTVAVEKNLNADGTVSVTSVEMRMFGKVIAAAIT